MQPKLSDIWPRSVDNSVVQWLLNAFDSKNHLEEKAYVLLKKKKKNHGPPPRDPN